MCGGEGEVLKKGGESRIGRAKLEATTVLPLSQNGSCYLKIQGSPTAAPVARTAQGQTHPGRTFTFLLTSDGGENCRDGGTKTDLRSISRCVPIPRWKVFFYELVCANKATDQCEC